MPLTGVVLDNVKIHYRFDANKLDDWLVDHRSILLHLPPYNPELKPNTIGIGS